MILSGQDSRPSLPDHRFTHTKFLTAPSGTPPNRDLRELTAQPTISTGQITYDLRRLRTRQLIERIPSTHRYHVTDTGLHTAMFLTRLHDRVLHAGLAQLTPTAPAGKLRHAATAYQTAIDELIRDAGLAT